MAYLLTYIALLWGYKLIMRKFPLILCNYRECFQVKSLVCKWEAINSFFFQPSFFLLFNSHLGSAVMWFVEFSVKKFSEQIGKNVNQKVYNFGANKINNCVLFSQKDLGLHKQSIFTTSKMDCQFTPLF